MKKGETLGQIATKYGVTVDDLRKWNNIKGNNIAAGQNLKVYSDKKVDRKTDKPTRRARKAENPQGEERRDARRDCRKYGVGLSKLKKPTASRATTSRLDSR